MPPVELDPRLATLPAADLAALIIAVRDAQQSGVIGDVTISGKQYQWKLGEPVTETEDDQSLLTAVLRIEPKPPTPDLGTRFAP